MKVIRVVINIYSGLAYINEQTQPIIFMLCITHCKTTMTFPIGLPYRTSLFHYFLTKEHRLLLCMT